MRPRKQSKISKQIKVTDCALVGYAQALGIDLGLWERQLRAKVASHADRLSSMGVRTFSIKDYQQLIMIVVEDLTVIEVRPLKKRRQ